MVGHKQGGRGYQKGSSGGGSRVMQEGGVGRKRKGARRAAAQAPQVRVSCDGLAATETAGRTLLPEARLPQARSCRRAAAKRAPKTGPRPAAPSGSSAAACVWAWPGTQAHSCTRRSSAPAAGSAGRWVRRPAARRRRSGPAQDEAEGAVAAEAAAAAAAAPTAAAQPAPRGRGRAC